MGRCQDPRNSPHLTGAERAGRIKRVRKGLSKGSSDPVVQTSWQNGECNRRATIIRTLSVTCLNTHTHPHTHTPQSHVEDHPSSAYSLARDSQMRMRRGERKGRYHLGYRILQRFACKKRLEDSRWEMGVKGQGASPACMGEDSVTQAFWVGGQMV